MIRRFLTLKNFEENFEFQDFNRIDSIRGSQRRAKRRDDEDKRNKELTQNPDLYQLSQKPPTQGLDNAGFDAVSCFTL